MDIYKKITSPLLALDTMLQTRIKSEDIDVIYEFVEDLERYVSFREEELKYLKNKEIERSEEYKREAEKKLHQIMTKYNDL